jgi:hypothetical protein
MHTRLMLAFPVFALLALFAFILEAQETEAGIHPDVAGLKAAKFMDSTASDTSGSPFRHHRIGCAQSTGCL